MIEKESRRRKSSNIYINIKRVISEHPSCRDFRTNVWICKIYKRLSGKE